MTNDKYGVRPYSIDRTLPDDSWRCWWMEFYEEVLVCSETKNLVNVTEYMAGCPLCPKHVREWKKVGYIETKVLEEGVFGHLLTDAEGKFIGQLLRGEI